VKRIRVVGIFLIILAVFLGATPVYADTPDPDNDPTIEEINIYRNLLVTGDWLTLIYANIPYGIPPSTSVSQTFIWRLMHTDNVTELGDTIGCAYNDDGYGYNVYSMYLSATEVGAKGMVWGTPYTIRLSGNPAVFDTPPIYNYVVNAGDYSTETVQSNVQAELASRIFVLAADLDTKWGLSTIYSLLTQNETATVLSIYGEAFFRCAIHGLQSMAPTAFSVIIRVIDVPSRNWTSEYSTNLTNQWAGTWIETAQEAGDALFGTDYNLLSIIMLLIMCGGLMVGNIMLTGDHWNGFIDCALLAVVGARLGMYDLGFLILLTALCWIYISAKIWFGFIK